MTRVLLAVFMLGGATAAAAQTFDEGIRGEVNLTAGAAAVVPFGNVHDGGTGTVLGLPTTVESRNYRDAYELGYAWRLGLGYGLTRTMEVVGDFTWENAESSPLSVGNVAGLDLRADFDRYRSYGLEGGLRWYAATGAVRPFLGGVGGFKRVSRVSSTFSVPAAGVVLSDTPFYAASTVPVVGGDAGVLFALTSRVGFGVQTGLRYQGKLTDVDGLAGTGLENLNDVGDRWSVPVTGLLRVRF
jgi:hypothetical protein